MVVEEFSGGHVQAGLPARSAKQAPAARHTGAGWRGTARGYAAGVPRLRALAMVCLSAVLAGAAAAAEREPQPLPGNSGNAQDILRALMELRRGDGAALQALPWSAYTAPIALAEAADASLQRRWTSALPAILAGLHATTRAAVLTELDQAYRACLPPAATPAEALTLAGAFLPAPSALHAIGAEADVAFDHGRFQDFLGLHGLSTLYAGSPPAPHDTRAEVARALSGRAAAVDPSLELSPPGTPLPALAPLSERAPRLGVRWAVVPGWLLACDPWGLPLWQYRVDRSARVTTGDGAALVEDSQGLRALSDQGAITALPPLPAGAHALAVSGGAAWFSAAGQGYRFDLASAAIARLALGEEPCGAPLVRGGRSLWLLPRELLLFDGDQRIAHLRHGLPVERGWRLSGLGSQALIIALDGSLWRLESLAEQLNHAAPGEQGRLLVAAGRYQEAILRLAGAPAALTADERALLLQAHLGLGPRHAAAHLNELIALAGDAHAELLVRQCAYGGFAAAGDAAGEHQAGVQAAAVARLAQTAPDEAFSPCTLLPGTTSDFSEPPGLWPHTLSGRGYLRALNELHGSALPTLDLAEPVVAEAVPATVADGAPALEEHRAADGSTAYRGRVLRLTSTIERKDLRCFERDGALLWRHRWVALPSLVAPGTLVTCRGAAVFVVEGQRRVRAFDLSSGALLAEHALDQASTVGVDFCLLPGARLVQLGPPGVGTRLEFLDLPTTPAVTLPAPARWLLALAGAAVVCLQDGSVLAYPGGTAVALPAALRARAQAPTLCAAGRLAGAQLYRWRLR